MKVKTVATAPLSWGRSCLGAARSLSPAAVVAVTLAIIFGGVGAADAATGGNFILGSQTANRRRQPCRTPTEPRSSWSHLAMPLL
jgi:hypothetical protein